MCGIFGTFKSPLDVQAGLDRIRHRGPDGSGIAAAGPAMHGHVRLSLLDLSDASAQPFRQGDGLLSFVGEIWNYREVREDLRRFGREFRTTGDTEVLAQALDQWGIDALPRLDGMFAFTWSKGSTHVLARDRYGKIPLYVRRKGAGFAWCNERKGFADPSSSSPLPPGCWLDLATGKVSRWYSLPEAALPADVLGLLAEGVRKRLNSDAPVCCLISGGLDSSLILAIAREHRRDVVAYTARLAADSADLAAARSLCRDLKVELVEVPVALPDCRAVAAAISAVEIASKAQIEIALLCLPLARRIAADGFKACLSGEAADELFGGYGNMCIKGSKASDAEWRAIRVAQLEKMSRGNFVRCNKVFMAHGVECRLPFMERVLVESVLAMPRAQCPPGKRLLKQAARKVLPASIVNRVKQTFQGGAGMSEACGRLVANPVRYYNAETRRLFGDILTS